LITLLKTTVTVVQAYSTVRKSRHILYLIRLVCWEPPMSGCCGILYTRRASCTRQWPQSCWPNSCMSQPVERLLHGWG